MYWPLIVQWCYIKYNQSNVLVRERDNSESLTLNTNARSLWLDCFWQHHFLQLNWEH